MTVPKDDAKIVQLAEQYSKIQQESAWIDLMEYLKFKVEEANSKMYEYDGPEYYKAHGRVEFAKIIINRADCFIKQREVILKIQEDEENNE